MNFEAWIKDRGAAPLKFGRYVVRHSKQYPIIKADLGWTVMTATVHAANYELTAPSNKMLSAGELASAIGLIVKIDTLVRTGVPLKGRLGVVRRKNGKLFMGETELSPEALFALLI